MAAHRSEELVVWEKRPSERAAGCRGATSTADAGPLKTSTTGHCAVFLTSCPPRPLYQGWGAANTNILPRPRAAGVNLFQLRTNQDTTSTTRSLP